MPFVLSKGIQSLIFQVFKATTNLKHSLFLDKVSLFPNNKMFSKSFAVRNRKKITNREKT